MPDASSPQQQDTISLLRQSIKGLSKYAKLTPDEFDHLEENDRLKYYKRVEEHIKTIAEAIRRGLFGHPLVSNFVHLYKVRGNKKVLRKIKRGLEKDVNRPLKDKDIKFKLYLDKIEEYQNAGKTWKEIRRILMKRKIIGNITLEALRKKVAKFAPHLLRNTGFLITNDMLHLITDDIRNRMKELWRELYASGRKSQYRQEVKKLFESQGGD